MNTTFLLSSNSRSTAGFFLAAAGKGVTTPNRFIVLLYAGVASSACSQHSAGMRRTYSHLGAVSDTGAEKREIKHS